MITVLGLGFVGLTTALGFAEKGFKVFGFELNRERLDELASGRVPFYEPGLPEKLEEHLNNNFVLVSNLSDALKDSDVVIFCVGTPTNADGKVDLGQLKVAVDSVLNAVEDDRFRVLCIKSTVPPSTTKDDIGGFLRAHGRTVGVDVGLANNPEFLREGYAWDDFINPDRVVIGTSDDKSREIMNQIYEPFGVEIHNVTLNTGEYIKYLSNALLSTLISFANEFAMVAHTVGDVEIQKAFNILHQDKRWFGDPAKMSTYAYPGCGFGGYCLPKDTLAMIGKADDCGYDARLLKAVLDVNENVRSFLTARLAKEVKPGTRIALLGLSFKPHSDDVRMTPAAWVIEELKGRGLDNIIAYDPIAIDPFKKLYNFGIEFADSLEQAVAEAEAVVLVTAWPEFKEKKGMYEGKTLFDFRYYL